ncbi:MAG TPA: hypothetical protein VFB58_13780 [Chloroflexota bacterium]|nr:hypothetical protein [Chloroflexota bacterium]
MAGDQKAIDRLRKLAEKAQDDPEIAEKLRKRLHTHLNKQGKPDPTKTRYIPVKKIPKEEL